MRDRVRVMVKTRVRVMVRARVVVTRTWVRVRGRAQACGSLIRPTSGRGRVLVVSHSRPFLGFEDGIGP